MMVKRRPVRQLSLQQNGTQRRPTLKKQQSEDDAGLRVTASSIRSSASTPVQAPTSAHSAAGFRPLRPVKLAWTDRRSPEQVATSPPGVEVIARRLPRQPRPTPNSSTSNKSRSNLPSIDKDSILYTRQQLAERLRRAWKEREQSRPNLDIFLAHHSVETAVEDTSPVHEPTPRDCSTPFSTSPSTLRLSISSPLSEPHSEHTYPKKANDSASLCSTPSSARIEDSAEPQYNYSSPTIHNFTPFPKSSTTIPEAHSQQPVNNSSIGEQLKTPITNETKNAAIMDASQSIQQQADKEEEEETAFEGSREKERTSCTKVTAIESNIAAGGKEVSEERQNENKNNAAAKRVSFRNSRSTTISNSFCIDEPPPSPPPVPSTPVPPARAVSAPSNRGILVNREVKKEVSANSSEAAVNTLARNIRSAPANKRRLKPSASVVTGKAIRAKPGVRGAGEESSGGEEGGDKKRPTGRRGVPRGAEIVTMVSLLSDDDEDGSNNGGDADQAAPGFLHFPQQQQSKQTATAPTCLMEADTRLPATPPSALVPPRVVCLRKTPKSVTFQHPPATTWKVTSSTPTPAAPRQVTPIIVPVSRRSSVSSLRPSSAPAGTKERTPETEAPKEEQTEKKQLELDSNTEVTQVPDVTQQNTPLPSPTPSESVVPEHSSPGVGVMVARILKPAGQGQEFCVRQEQPPQEPQFQTPKERECWQLYRKMLEKGVAVSYDTVLRGMLTPTEYRLRRGALLSSC